MPESETSSYPDSDEESFVSSVAAAAEGDQDGPPKPPRSYLAEDSPSPPRPTNRPAESFSPRVKEGIKKKYILSYFKLCANLI